MDNTYKKINERKKEYLRGYRKHGRRIKRIESEIEEIRSMKMNPSMNNDGMPKGNEKGDLSDYAVKLVAMENELYEEGMQQVKTYKDILYQINQIEDQDERDVLFYRYIKGLAWWEVARMMDLSESRVYVIHGEALKKVNIF